MALYYTSLYYSTHLCTTVHITALFFTTHHCTTVHITALQYTSLYHSIFVPQYTSLHNSTHHCTTVHITALQYTSLHYSTHHCTRVHITVLHYTALQYSVQLGIGGECDKDAGYRSRTRIIARLDKGNTALCLLDYCTLFYVRRMHI